jgi:hypothetical protein
VWSTAIVHEREEGYEASPIWSAPISSRFRAGHSLEELRTIATAPGWQGYLSAPARSTAAHGRAVEDWWMEGFTDLILRAVGGENLFSHARVPDSLPGAVATILERELANETAFEEKLENWLVQRRRH